MPGFPTQCSCYSRSQAEEVAAAAEQVEQLAGRQHGRRLVGLYMPGKATSGRRSAGRRLWELSQVLACYRT